MKSDPESPNPDLNETGESPHPQGDGSPPLGEGEADQKVIDLDATPTAAAASGVAVPPISDVPSEEPSLTEKVKELLIGRPRDLADRTIFHSLSLVAFLAWVGLGADGLSSSCYGPEEAFRDLGEHRYLAVFLAVMTAATVVLISSCYSRIIEEFPSGGGGYLVASKLLGAAMGPVSGCALMVGYVLTITASVAAAGDALFGLLGPDWKLAGIGPDHWKLLVESAAILFLIVLNLRGVRESVIFLLPIFLAFIISHVVIIVGAIALHVTSVGSVVREVADGVGEGVRDETFGLWAMLLLVVTAYTRGASTYTGIEALSNSMAVLREPRVATGKRTMIYMAGSLAAMSSGLLVCYLLLRIRPDPIKTMNLLLTEQFVTELGGAGTVVGSGFVWLTILAEGLLLLVAAQAGFIGGPATLANMARDSWVPHWFGNLSERLAAHNGVLLLGAAALVALWLTDGEVPLLLTIYLLNVFVTFSLSMLGMCRLSWDERATEPNWWRRLVLFAAGLFVCVMILVVTVLHRFAEGGAVTIAVAIVSIGTCFLLRRYYRRVLLKLRRLDAIFGELPSVGEANRAEPDPNEPTAVILVGGYSGLGVHTLLNTVRFAPGYFKSVIFVSVGVVDSGNFKGARAIDDLRNHTTTSLGKFVDLARGMGLSAKAFMAIGTDAVDELEQLCIAVSKLYPRSTFFAGQLVFQRDTWYQRLLHNETAWSLQRRLQWASLTMVILPTRVR